MEECEPALPARAVSATGTPVADVNEKQSRLQMMRAHYRTHTTVQPSMHEKTRCMTGFLKSTFRLTGWETDPERGAAINSRVSYETTPDGQKPSGPPKVAPAIDCIRVAVSLITDGYTFAKPYFQFAASTASS